MAIGDMLFALMGRPNPRDQLAEALGHAPGMTGSPNAGIVPGQGGGVGSIGLAGRGPNAPPDQNPQQGQPQQGQQGGQQSQQPPQPQAYTTQPDLAQTYLQLMQRAQANQQINSGMGLLAAGLSHNQQNREIMVNSMSQLNNAQAASGIGGAGGLGDLGKLIQTQREMAMQNYMLNHIKEGAASLGITPDQYLTGYMTGKLGDIESNIIQQQHLEASPKYKADIAEAQARTALSQGQAGAIPSTIAKTQADTAEAQARTGAIPADVALKQQQAAEAAARASAVPSTIAKTQAEAAAIPTHTALEQAQAGAIPADIVLKQAEAKKNLAEASGPTDALRNYNFAVQQFQADPNNAGKTPPTFDQWNAQQSGMKEAATQQALLSTQQKMSAQAAMPDAIKKVAEYQKLADDILNDPMLSTLTGPVGGSLFKAIADRGGPGSALQAKIDQLRGASGVSAVDALKGGVGRILGVEFNESDKAQSRLSDQHLQVEDFKEAVRDYRDSLSMDLANVTQKSGMAVPQYLQQWVSDPTTGKVPGIELRKVPPSAIEHLKANPQLRDQFDSKYGKGMSGWVLR